jgi:NDP-sugar pyrophosphorylase family protein
LGGTKAVLLTGGLGTRLRPLTHKVPKPLVPVANRALISYPLAMLRQGGVEEAILACGYRADSLRAGIERLGDLGLVVRLAEEKRPLDTAGAVRNALTSADEPFVVMNGDQIMDVDVGALLAAHEQRQADLTIVVRRVPDVAAYGLVPCDVGGRVQEFGEKRPFDPTGRNLINTGMYVFSPNVLSAIPKGEPFSNERQLFPGLIRDGRPVFAFRMSEEAFWADVGTPANYLETNRDLLNDALSGVPLATVAAGADVSPDASLSAPISLAEGCEIGPGTEVGPNVSVGERATIAEAVAIRNSILWPSSHVGARSRLANVIVGPGYHVPEDTVLEPNEATIIPGDNDGDDAE